MSRKSSGAKAAKIIPIQLSDENAGEMLVAWQAYKAITPEELSLNEGDLVELLDTEDPSVPGAKRRKIDPALDVGGEGLLDSSAARHKLSVKPKKSRSSSRYSPSRNPLNARWLVKMVKGDHKQGWVPCQVLQTADDPQPGTGLPGDASFRRQAVVKELVETEQEFVRDLDFVVQKYLIGSDKERKPKLIKDNFDLIFGNLKEIAEFHRTVLMEGVKYYANEPHLLGKAFLRLERDFDKHVNYCKEEPLAQAFLDSCNVARDYFEELSTRLADDKSISEHLKLPIQRINDYQLLLKELVRYSACLGEDNTDLQKALELMLSVPHRAQDDKFTNSIEGYRGSIHKLGRLLAHDWFSVCFGDITKERYLFLFKARILISKVRRISDDRSVFQLKDIVKLPQVEVKDFPDDPFSFELTDKTAGHVLKLTGHRENVKQFWLEEIREFASEAEEGVEDIQVISQPPSPPEPVEAKYQLPKSIEKVVQQQQKVEVKQETKQEAKTATTTTTSTTKQEAKVVQQQQEVKVTQVAQVETKTAKQEVKVAQSSVSSTVAQQEVKVEVKTTQQSSKVEVAQQEVKVVKQEVKSEISNPQPTQNPIEKSSTTESVGKTSAELIKFRGHKLDNPKLKGSQIAVPGIEHTASSSFLARDGSRSSIPDYGDSFRVNVEVDLEVDKDPKKHITDYGIVESGASEEMSSYSRRTTSGSYSSEGSSTRKYESKYSSKSLDSEGVGESLSSYRRSSSKDDSDDYGSSSRRSVREKRSTRSSVIDDDDVSKARRERLLRMSIDEEDPDAYTSKIRSRGTERTTSSTDESSTYMRSLNAKTSLDEDEDTYLAKIRARSEAGYTRSTSRDGQKSISYARELSEEMDAEAYISKMKRSTSRDAQKSSYARELSEDMEAEAYISKMKRSTSKDTQRSTYAREVSEDMDAEAYISKMKRSTSRDAQRTSYARELSEDMDPEAYISKIKSNRSEEIGYKRTTSTDSTEVGYSRSTSIGGQDDEDRLAKFEKYSKRKSSSDQTNSDSFQSVTQKTKFDGKILEEVVKSRSKSDLGMAPPDESPKFTKTIGGVHVRPHETVTFEIKLEDTPDSLTWLKENRALDGDLARRTKITSLNEHKTWRLQIEDVVDKDSGTFTAVACNAKGKSTCTTHLLVHKLTEEEELEMKKPEFIIKFKDTELLEDTYMRFMCKVKGDPHPKLTFYKDGKEIKDSDRLSVNRDHSDTDFYEVVIPDVKQADAGVYKCVAKNEHGEDSTEATVTVTGSKHLFDEFADSEGLLPKGEKPTFIWKKDGQSVDVDERFKVLMGDDEDSLALIFQHVKPEDAGLYTCVAQTTTGHISCSAELTVQGTVHELYREPEKPQLIIEKRDPITAIGGSCMMELQVKGFPKPKVTWTHEGQPVEPSSKYKFLYEDEETMSLVIKNVEGADAGKYEITAENELGQDIREMHLTVKAPPTLSIMQDTTASTDQELKMTVLVEGIPEPNVQFYKNGKVIKSSEQISVVKEGNKHSVVIKKTTLNDSGSFSVVANNEMAQVTQLWNLDIYCKPKILKKLGESKEVHQNIDLDLSIKLESEPAAEVTWYKDGVEIKADSHYTIENDGATYTLRISGTVTTDSASYKCKAKNIHGTIDDEVRVDVKRKPTFTKGLEDMTVTEHEKNVTFDVKVDSFPKPQVKWFLDEVEISESRKEFTQVHSDDGLKLVIKEVVSELSGKYTCKVINELGDTSTSAKLTVNCKPRIVKQLKDTTVEENAALHLEIEVESVPEATVKWLRNGREVTADARIKITRDQHRQENYHLTVNLIKYEEQGEYEVQVTNTMGTVSSKSNVTVHKVTHTDAEEVTEEPVKLTLTVIECDQEQDVTIEDVTEVDAQTSTHEGEVDENLPTPVVIEEVDIEAESKIVIKSPSEEVQRGTFDDDDDEDAYKAMPQIVEHNMKDRKQFESLATAFSVKTSGNPTPTATWSLNGEVLKPGANQRYKITDDGNEHKLEMSRLKAVDAGAIEVTISNCVGDVKQQGKLETTPEAELRRPKIRDGQGLQDTTILKKKSATLKAIVVGDPVPEITWLFMGKKITKEQIEEHKMVLETHHTDIQDGLKECAFTLTIPRSERIHGGNYSLKVKNKWGEATSSAILTVVLSPEIEGPDYVKVVPGDATELVAIIQSNPPPIVTWTKSENVIEASGDIEILVDLENEKYTLKFNKVQLSDEGYYKVYAKNEYGESSSEGRIKTIKEPDPTSEKPQFITGLTDGQVPHGGEITLMVRADGLPRPDVKWFINDKEITEAPGLIFSTTSDRQLTSSLTITDFQEKDIGIYKVTAVNVVGDVETSARVSMLQTPPTFGKRLEKSQEVNEGEPLALKAKISGSPKPTVAWFKDGLPIDPNDPRIKTELLPDGTVKLNIDQVSPEDSGAYKLVVKNANGETAGLCAVVVNAKPQRPMFTKCIKDTKVVLGEPLKLAAKVSANPPPEIKWMKDGLPVRASSNIRMEHHPDGTVALIVDNVKPENAGKYTLIVANKMGEISGDANVEIEKRPNKPEFVTKMQPQTVVEGFPAKFEVKAVGHPQPTIAWLRNGAEVVSDSKHIKVTDLPDGVSVLHIEACDSVRDAMTYVAVARNEAGEVKTSAPLTVNPASRSDRPEERPQFLHSLRDVITDEGQPLVLEAPFTGNPIPTVEWSKDGVPIKPSERILLTCDGRKVGLTIDHALPSDAAQYAVTIINPLGSESCQAKASVHKVFQAPSFTQKFGDLQQVPGRDAKFPARVSGVPQPEVTWTKDGQALRDSDKYRIKRDGDACCLYVMDSQDEDAGCYMATATNKEGSATCIGKLEVVKEIKASKKMEPANFVKKLGDTELYKGMTAKFTACVAGIPEPQVEWYRNDQRLYPADRIKMETDRNGLLRLTIAGVDQDDIGKYTCKIFNEHGSDSCDAYLRFDEGIEAKPKRLTDQYTDYDKYKKSGAPMPLSDCPIISRMTDRHCTVSWKPSIPSAPRAPVTYQLEMLEMPSGEWFTVRSGIRSCCCDVRNLEPFRDYKFRVRVENKYGISDPSPYALTHREKLEPDPPKFMPYLPPGIDFRPETSPYFPKDFDIDRPPHDNMAQPPRFLRQEYDAQYGVKDQSCNLFWFVYGYPKPRMTYYFNDLLIESGGRYDMSYTRNGQATLFINKMLERDVGFYEAVAVNEHGEARQRVRLEIAEAPCFIRRPDIEYVMVRGKARFEARITGVPYPEIKWYRDWKPLANSSRIKIQWMEPDTAILIVNESIFKDEGLYSVSARNVAGSISASAMLHIEENDLEYNIRTYQNPNPIKLRKKLYSEFYDIGDELGRGTQGITYHAAERLNGRNFAAKIMHGRGDFRPMMYNEWEMMNQLHHRRLISLHDAYEFDDNLTLITELAAGGELVKDYLLKVDYYTESDIAGYIRQLLQGIQYMHERGIGHMGLNIGDLLLSHPGSDELKICDFGLTRRIQMGKLYPLKFGVPEYVSPECANGEGTGLGHDMWSIGIITYIFLSGHSPFRGIHDMETLQRIQTGKWQFDETWWSHISIEARDFITKLLIYQAEGRMDVHAALRHPWLERCDKVWQDEYRISSKYLRDYYMLYREWYDNASCKRWFRRRPLEGAFTHPSRMVYPPGERCTPPPESPAAKAPKKKTWEDQIPSRSPLNYEIGSFKSESHYQNGPDTYLLQLRDVDFPVRLREYMKVAGSRGMGFAHIVSNENGYDWETPVIRERRRFTDVMDEEIDDERKTRINRYGSGESSYTIRRLRHEIGTRLDTYMEAEAFLESKMEGRLPFFREKPQMCAMQEGKDLELICMAVGDPDPVVQWFKNDSIIAESHRISITVDADGRSHLKFSPALSFDLGLYKVAARNKIGQTIARTRVVLGTVSDAPDSPEAAQVSDDQVLLTWKQPKHDGHSPVICYSVQYKLADDMEWIEKAKNVDHEFYLAQGLEAGQNYIFRLAAKNLMGWSDYGVASAVTMTLPVGAPKIQLSRAMMHLQQMTDTGVEVQTERRNSLVYSFENTPVDWIKSDPQEKYHFISEVSRGRFAAVVKAVNKQTDTVLVAKVIDTNAQGEDHVEGEFAALRSLRHERIATLREAYKSPDRSSVFILEKLQGADVLTYLATRHEYTEQTVATIIAQVLDGLQYLHWRGLCHLDLQPDNVVMCGVRSVEVKLVDFGCAHRVTKLGNRVPVVGNADYIAPEVLAEEPAFPQTDIWSVGVLTYVLLSGTLPFRAETPEESRQNTMFVRYRFEHLYKEVSQEGVRFVMLLFKRHANKRPTAEECHENRWLLPTDFMIKKRERAVFLGNRLKEYSEQYHSEKSKDQTTSGGKVGRSMSIQEELQTAPF